MHETPYLEALIFISSRSAWKGSSFSSRGHFELTPIETIVQSLAPMKAALLVIALLKTACNSVSAHASDQLPVVVQDGSQAWLEKYGKQIDIGFSGPLSFSHLPYTRCLENTTVQFDIGILGMPFGR